ncbi:MAG: 50S ribosomal protein L5, partial [Acidimicrobiia bacterium]|nr:50S ribosomal protein L5 [Acidimicrobiia bacterium]
AHSWDGRGNCTFGLNEQTMFAEIDPDTADHPRGMDITIVTTASDNAAGKALLDAFGFPFKKGAEAENAPRKKRRKTPDYGNQSK